MWAPGANGLETKNLSAENLEPREGFTQPPDCLNALCARDWVKAVHSASVERLTWAVTWTLSADWDGTFPIRPMLHNLTILTISKASLAEKPMVTCVPINPDLRNEIPNPTSLLIPEIGKTMKSVIATLSLTMVVIATHSSFAQRPYEERVHYENSNYGSGVAAASYFNPAEPAAPNTWSGSSAPNTSGYSDYVDGGVCNNLGRFSGGKHGFRILPTEDCFDSFISPVTNPFYFEDPRALTEIRPVYVHHNMPAALGGGSVNIYAMQLRARLSENVSLIMLKDGYFDSSSPLLDDGWADLGLGLKFHLWRDPVQQQLLSVGATFEAPSGSDQALQGLGSGNLNLFFSTARKIGSMWNHMSTGGIRIPMNGDTGSASTFVSQHLSRPLTERFFILTEVNWFRYVSSGTGGIPGIEALDIANLGSSDVTGNNIVNWAAGGKFKTSRGSEIGAAYEIPVSGRRDIMGNRVTAHWAIRY
jgi:hypothetical protein